MTRSVTRDQQALADEALIQSLSRQARAIAGADDGPPVGSLSRSPSPAAWHRLAQARAARRGGAKAARTPWWPRRRWLFGLTLGTATLAVMILVVGPRWLGRPRPLTFQVRGGAAEQGGYVRADQAGTGQVRFSDGTEIDLGENARLSVVTPEPRGARLRLDAGQARFRVVHRERAVWSVEAGPYVVAVTGTVFDVRWSSGDELVQVDLHQGSVRVSGPGLPDAVRLRAGQRLTARPGHGDVKIERAEFDGTPPAATAPSPTPAPAATASPAAAGNAAPAPPPPRAPPAPPRKPPEPTGRPAPRARMALAEPVRPHRTPASDAGPGLSSLAPSPSFPTPPTEPPPLAARGPNPLDSGGVGGTRVRPDRDRPVWTPRRWPARVANGEAAAVVEEAQQFGLAATLAQADPASLTALADAARYLRQPELAGQVLDRQRSRFPRTRLAAKAAFLLGRLADDRGDVSAATSWYGRYLVEAPRGAYADEALGRSMLVVEALEGAAEARSLAEKYLGRFPNGTYLLQARAIVNSNSEPGRR